MVIGLKMESFSYFIAKEGLRSPLDPPQMEKWIQQIGGYFTFLLFMITRKSEKFIVRMNIDSTLYQGRQVKPMKSLNTTCQLRREGQTNFGQAHLGSFAAKDYETKESKYMKLKLRDR